MNKQMMIDASEIIGVYPICNTGAVLLYEIDYAEDRVLASINTDMPEWCQLAEEYSERSAYPTSPWIWSRPKAESTDCKPHIRQHG